MYRSNVIVITMLIFGTIACSMQSTGLESKISHQELVQGAWFY